MRHPRALQQSWWRLSAGAVLLLCAGLAASPAALALQLSARDSRTGAFLNAFVQAPGAQTMTIRRGRHDVAPAELAASSEVQVSAPGYRPLTLRLLRAQAPTAVEVWLDPIQPARSDPASSTAIALRGWLYDPQSGLPVARAELHWGSARAISASDGAFALIWRDPRPETNPWRLPASEPLRVISRNGAGLSRSVRLIEGAQTLILDLVLTSDAASPDDRQQSDTVQQLAPLPLEDLSSAPVLAASVMKSGVMKSGVLNSSIGDASALDVPVSIRVGYADAGFSTTCCTGGCGSVAVMSFETYVRRGLNDEWIASWNPQSLRAGAIAYRSYGAWHVQNPLRPNYDICSSACCQVNDADVSSASTQAVDATIGIMLSRTQRVFRAEYSAENNGWDDPEDGLSCVNDSLCGDGLVGSASAGWPCMPDPVALGRGCFGHGRGMSQWGTQRWASLQSRRWPWIVDHYYNDNQNAQGAGSQLRTAVISSPLSVESVSAVPSVAVPGQLVRLRYQVRLRGAEAHASVWLGASLSSALGGVVSDPSRDAARSVAPGVSVLERDFLIPLQHPNADADIVATLYLDVDGSQSINSGDHALASMRATQGLRVDRAPLLKNGFE